MPTKKKTEIIDDLISQAEAARLRGVSRAAISELIRRGRLSTATIGGRVFVRRSEVLNFEELKSGPKKKRR